MTQQQLFAASVLGLAMMVLVGCGGAAPEPSPSVSPTPLIESPANERPTPSATAAPVPEHAAVGMVASVIGDTVVALDAPEGKPVADFTNPMREGVPLVFLVVNGDDNWLEVQLPIRPNGSTGWIRDAEVQLHSLPYALHVSTAERSVTLSKDGEVVKTFVAAIGTGDTPTPTGSYFITELLRPTNQGYGPYAFGISAFSEVLNSFGGGPGQIGLHGTSDESTIGQAVSHGCIRLNNEDITYLATILPLGTPITIV